MKTNIRIAAWTADQINKVNQIGLELSKQTYRIDNV